MRLAEVEFWVGNNWKKSKAFFTCLLVFGFGGRNNKKSKMKLFSVMDTSG